MFKKEMKTQVKKNKPLHYSKIVIHILLHRKTPIYLCLLLNLVICDVNAQKKIAVLIANQNYSKCSDLKTPINEINTIAAFCNDNKFKTLIFKDIPLDQYNTILDSIESLVEENSFLYIHYAGHGVQINSENYIVPIDAYPSTVTQAERQCVPIYLFVKLIKDYQSSHNIKSLICIDACRDNPFKEIVDNIDIGFSKIKYTPTNTGIIYSCAAGKQTADGSKDFSPFAKVWINQIKNCNLSLNDISTMIDGELLKLGLQEDRLPERQFVGLNSVYFCEPESISKAKKFESQISLINNLKEALEIDFANGNHNLVISKGKWIDSIMNINAILQEHLTNDDRLRMRYLMATSYFEICDFQRSQDIFEAIWSFMSKSDLKVKDYLYYDTYFYLGRIFSIDRNWAKLKCLRRDFLRRSIEMKKYLDIITTYDKMAGDFERENLLDSACIYYQVLENKISNYEITTPYEASCVMSFYNNIGKFQIWQSDYKSGIQNLTKAVSLINKYNLSSSYSLFDLADSYINISKIFNLDSGQLYLNYYKYATHLRDLENRLNYQYLELCLQRKMKISDSISTKLEDYFNELNNLVNTDIRHNEFGVKTFDSICSVPYWRLSLVLPKSIYPLLFIDLNLNNQHDTSDLIISPHILSSSNSHALQIDDSKTKEPALFIYQEHINIPSSGTFALRNNILEYDLRLNAQRIFNNSYITTEVIDTCRIWNFMMYKNEIGVRNNNQFYIGGTNITYQRKYIPRHSEKIFIVPANAGSKYLYKSLF